MSTSKATPNVTTGSKLEVPTTTVHPYQREVHQRISSSKRTTISNVDPPVDNSTTVLQQTRTHHMTRSIKQKDKCETANISPSKLESESEEVYTAPSHNERVHISSSIAQKQRIRQGRGDYIEQDADEESTAVCAMLNKNPMTTEQIHRLATSVNNSAIHPQQQQGTGDHYQSSSKQHRNRSKTSATLHRKYHRLVEQHDLETALEERNAYRWRMMMYILIILVLAFVIYRFLLAVWPKPKKTFMERFVDDLSTFFTP